jgi:excisionase family DNA binding protein
VSVLLLNLDPRAAGHAAVAVKTYMRVLDRQGYRCDPAVRRELEQLQAFLTDTGKEAGRSGKNPAKAAGVAGGGRDDGCDDLLTQKEAANRAGCSPRTIRNWLEQGLLPAVRVGKVRRISVVDLERFIEGGR